MNDKGKVTWKDCLIAILMCILVLLIAGIIVKDQPSPPVKGNVNIDSLLNANDSLKVVIQITDSVKNEKIEQVLALDNDSTLELFKQLVRE